MLFSMCYFLAFSANFPRTFENWDLPQRDVRDGIQGSEVIIIIFLFLLSEPKFYRSWSEAGKATPVVAVGVPSVPLLRR